jgi:hypothetical protein
MGAMVHRLQTFTKLVTSPATIQNMTPENFITQQLSERQTLLTEIHHIIISEDKTVTATDEPMMKQEMIVYKAAGFFKYGLASMKNYMSLHVMPIYGSQPLHNKYKYLLDKANFQKGCINFKTEGEMPLGIVKQLISDCAKIDLKKMKEEYLNSKKG